LDLKGGDDARGVLLEPVDRCGYRGPVRGVERGVDLVEVAEWRRVAALDRKDQREHDAVPRKLFQVVQRSLR